MPKKVIQVPVDAKLLKELDTLSKKQGKARAEVIREACARYITEVEEAEADRKYIESYRRMPETQEELEWAEMGAKLANEILAEEPW